MNPATARLLRCPFIDCASRRFNLAVQEYFSKYDESLEAIHNLMKQLKTLKNGGSADKKRYTSNFKKQNSMVINLCNVEPIFQIERFNYCIE